MGSGSTFHLLRPITAGFPNQLAQPADTWRCCLLLRVLCRVKLVVTEIPSLRLRYIDNFATKRDLLDANMVGADTRRTPTAARQAAAVAAAQQRWGCLGLH